MAPRDKHLVAKALAIAVAQMRRETSPSEKSWQAADMERILRSLLESDDEFRWFMEVAGQIVEGQRTVWTEAPGVNSAAMLDVAPPEQSDIP